MSNIPKKICDPLEYSFSGTLVQRRDLCDCGVAVHFQKPLGHVIEARGHCLHRWPEPKAKHKRKGRNINLLVFR